MANSDPPDDYPCYTWPGLIELLEDSQLGESLAKSTTSETPVATTANHVTFLFNIL